MIMERSVFVLMGAEALVSLSLSLLRKLPASFSLAAFKVRGRESVL